MYIKIYFFIFIISLLSGCGGKIIIDPNNIKDDTVNYYAGADERAHHLLVNAASNHVYYYFSATYLPPNHSSIPNDVINAHPHGNIDSIDLVQQCQIQSGSLLKLDEDTNTILLAAKIGRLTGNLTRETIMNSMQPIFSLSQVEKGGQCQISNGGIAFGPAVPWRRENPINVSFAFLYKGNTSVPVGNISNIMGTVVNIASLPVGGPLISSGLHRQIHQWGNSAEQYIEDKLRSDTVLTGNLEFNVNWTHHTRQFMALTYIDENEHKHNAGWIAFQFRIEPTIFQNMGSRANHYPDMSTVTINNVSTVRINNGGANHRSYIETATTGFTSSTSLNTFKTVCDTDAIAKLAEFNTTDTDNASALKLLLRQNTILSTSVPGEIYIPVPTSPPGRTAFSTQQAKQYYEKLDIEKSQLIEIREPLLTLKKFLEADCIADNNIQIAANEVGIVFADEPISVINSRIELINERLGKIEDYKSTYIVRPWIYADQLFASLWNGLGANPDTPKRRSLIDNVFGDATQNVRIKSIGGALGINADGNTDISGDDILTTLQPLRHKAAGCYLETTFKNPSVGINHDRPVWDELSSVNQGDNAVGLYINKDDSNVYMIAIKIGRGISSDPNKAFIKELKIAIANPSEVSVWKDRQANLIWSENCKNILNSLDQ